MAISPVLILFAHPAIEGSRINQPMVDAIAGVEGVTVHDLYESYPDIDVAREQALVEIHDVIVFHHPMRWYNCPALLWLWFDLVLTQGWAYGDGAVALVGPGRRGRRRAPPPTDPSVRDYRTRFLTSQVRSRCFAMSA